MLCLFCSVKFLYDQDQVNIRQLQIAGVGRPSYFLINCTAFVMNLKLREEFVRFQALKIYPSQFIGLYGVLSVC